MPFTLAHPAAVLPLRGVPRLQTAPLIIGAIVPDLPYYLPWGRLHSIDLHEFRSSYTSCLMLGYLLLLVLLLLRRPLTALLSARARWLCLRALEPLRRHWSAWVFAGVAIVIGVWTHLLWDSFTHPDGWMVRRVAALSAPVTLGSYTGPLYHVLQYVSSVFGLLVMAWWYWRLPAPPAAPLGRGAARSAAGPILVLVMSAAVLIGGVQATAHFHRSHIIYRSINIALTHSLTWFAVLYLTAGILISLEHRSVPTR